MHILCLKLLAFSFTNATWVIEWVNEVSYSHIAFRMMKKLLEIQSNHSDWNAFATKSKQSQTNQMLSLTFLTDSWSCTAKPHFLAENQCETLSSCATHTWRIVIDWIRMQFVEWLCEGVWWVFVPSGLATESGFYAGMLVICNEKKRWTLN